MRISDWSSDVCSSDLITLNSVRPELVEGPSFFKRRIESTALRQAQGKRGRKTYHHFSARAVNPARSSIASTAFSTPCSSKALPMICKPRGRDRKSGVEGQRVEVGVDVGGRGVIK